MFSSWSSSPDGREVRQRVPDPRCAGALRHPRAGDECVVGAVRLVALGHVVPPRDVRPVQQVGQVRPGVDRGLVARVLGGVEVGRVARVADVVRARVRVVVVAERGPQGHREQVGGQAPRAVRLEHVVLQHEVARVGPVVRDLPVVVVPHHVALRGGEALGVVGVGAAAAEPGLLGLHQEAVHRAAVDVGHRVGMPVRAAAVDVAGVVVRREAAAAAPGSGRRPRCSRPACAGSRRRRDTCRSSCRRTGSPASPRRRA